MSDTSLDEHRRTSTGRSSSRAIASSRASSTHGRRRTLRPRARRPPDVDAACRALVRALGEAAGCARRRRRGARRRRRRDRHARALPRARDARAPLRPRRFRLRDAGPRLRRHHASPARPSRRRAPCRGSRAARRSPRSRSPSPMPAPTSPRWRCAARADGDAYVLDGEKTWISNGGIADFYVVFARTRRSAGARAASRLSSSTRHARASRSPSAST